MSLVLSACATSQNSSSRPAASARPAVHSVGQTKASEDPEVKEIQVLYRRGQHRLVVDRIKAYERKFPRSPYLATLFNLQGLSYLAEKNILFSTAAFQKAIKNSPNPASVPYLQYNLANAQYQGQQYDEAFQTIAEVRSDTVDADTREKLALLKSKIYRKKELAADGVRELLDSLKSGKGQPAIERELRNALSEIKSTELIEAVLADYSKSPGADILLFFLAQNDLKTKNAASAKNRFQRIVDDFPDSELADRARAELSSDAPQSAASSSIAIPSADPKAIGVLLPLSGKYSSYGTSVAQAVALAFQLYEPAKTGHPYEIFFEDSKETEAEALEAFERLVNDHHVIAVVGPLTSKGIEKLAERASQYGVPLLSLAQKEIANSPMLFPFGLTPQKQADALVDHAFDKLNIKTFAILSPRGKFGDEYSNAFWDAVEQKGGKIVGYETYGDGETDFRQYIDKLSGLYYTGARAKELEDLNMLRTKDKIKKRTRKTESYFALKPLVDYQAVFIPDEAKVVGQILPTFGFRDVDNILFLGPSTWRSPELLTRVRKEAEGSVLTDAFFENSNDPLVIKFVDRYQDQYAHAPGMIDALAYDASSFLKQLMASGISNRADLIRQIHDTSLFAGVTGQIRFKDRSLERTLKIITVKSNQFVEVTENSADWHP